MKTPIGYCSPATPPGAAGHWSAQRAATDKVDAGEQDNGTDQQHQEGA
jgi:hypothetical protein